MNAQRLGKFAELTCTRPHHRGEHEPILVVVRSQRRIFQFLPLSLPGRGVRRRWVRAARHTVRKAS